MDAPNILCSNSMGDSNNDAYFTRGRLKNVNKGDQIEIEVKWGKLSDKEKQRWIVVSKKHKFPFEKKKESNKSTDQCVRSGSKSLLSN